MPLGAKRILPKYAKMMNALRTTLEMVASDSAGDDRVAGIAMRISGLSGT
jgi:hypothetical protein